MILFIFIISLLHTTCRAQGTHTTPTETKDALIKDENERLIHRVANSDMIEIDGAVYSLSNVRELHLFTADAHYYINDEMQDASESISSNIFYGDIGDEIILVSYFNNKYEDMSARTSEDLDIERVTLVNKSRGHLVATFISTQVGNEMKLLRIQQSEDHDYEELKKKFIVSGYDQHNDSEDDIEEELGIGMRLFGISKGFSFRGALTEDMPCTDFQEIELGIAFESTFCQEKGGEEEAVSDILRIMALVSLRYEQNDLCTKVRISHLEGYCESDIDPYRDGVELNKGGCNEDDYGAKDYFAEYWQDNRSHIHRDAAMLFSGTPLECDSEEGRCVVGCANIKSLCDKERGYSVVDGSFMAGGDDNARAVLVSHELGHMSGAHHEDEAHSIMSPLLSDGSNGFGRDSICSIQRHMKKSRCITEFDAYRWRKPM